MPGFSLPGGRLWLVAPVAAAAATAAYASAPPPPPRLRPSERPIVNEKCVQRLLAEPGAKAVPSGGQMLRRHGIIGRLIAQDHWFDMMESEQMVQDMVCVYNKETQKFHTIVRVGRDVCGYPKTVHGGLTAAIADESFGGLYVSLWTTGKLGVRPPGLTARLEVDYLRKLAADTIIVCSTEVEEVVGRKVWMRSHVYDGLTNKDCATARALFVAPRWSSVAKSALPFVKSQR